MHAAGPFQRATKCTVLEAAIATKVVTSSQYLGIIGSLFQWFPLVLRSFVDVCIGFENRYILFFLYTALLHLCDAILFCCLLYCTHRWPGLVVQTAYIDVCDDSDYSKLAKAYHQQALTAGVPAITTAGIYPGVSNSTFSFNYCYVF